MNKWLLIIASLSLFGSGVFVGGIIKSKKTSSVSRESKIGIRNSEQSYRLRDRAQGRVDLISEDRGVSLSKKCERVLADADFHKRKKAFGQMLEELTPENAPEYVEAVMASDLAGVDNSKEWEGVFQRWGKLDPKGALNFLEETDTSVWHSWAEGGARYHIFVGWAEQNAAEAMKFATEEGFVEKDQNIIAPIMSNWAQQDSSAATDFIFDQTDGKYRHHLGQITEIIARGQGTEALVAWQRDVKSRDPENQEYVNRVVSAHMRHLPVEQVVSWLTSEAVDDRGGVSINTASTAYRHVSSHYPSRGPEFLAELSQHKLSSQALNYLVHRELENSQSKLPEYLKERVDDSSLDTLRAIFESAKQSKR